MGRRAARGAAVDEYREFYGLGSTIANAVVHNDVKEEEMKLHSLTRQSRRSLVAKGTAVGLAGPLPKPTASAVSINTEQSATCPANVKSFGARGTGTGDETAGFQRALDAMHRAGGGMVYAPPRSIAD
jgi:polygalacturonase